MAGAQSRRLTTIVALDVAGYSAGTEADEAAAAAEVAALRSVIEAIAGPHGGRVFNTAGDGFMLELGASLAAVEAALVHRAECTVSDRSPGPARGTRRPAPRPHRVRRPR